MIQLINGICIPRKLWRAKMKLMKNWGGLNKIKAVRVLLAWGLHLLFTFISTLFFRHRFEYYTFFSAEFINSRNRVDYISLCNKKRKKSIRTLIFFRSLCIRYFRVYEKKSHTRQTKSYHRVCQGKEVLKPCAFSRIITSKFFTFTFYDFTFTPLHLVKKKKWMYSHVWGNVCI